MSGQSQEEIEKFIDQAALINGCTAELLLTLSEKTDIGDDEMRLALEQMEQENIPFIPPPRRLTDQHAVRQLVKQIRESCREEEEQKHSHNDPLELYLAELPHSPALSMEQKRRIAESICDQSEGTQQLYEQLFEDMAYLSVEAALPYLGRGVLFLDLVQEGNLALMELIYSWDYTTRMSLDAYAMYRLDQCMKELTAAQEDVLRVPHSMAEDLSRVRKAEQEIQSSENRQAQAGELAKALGLSKERVEEILSAERGLMTTAADQDHTDSVAETRNDAEAAMSQQVQQLLKTLPEKEANVISLRFGIGEEKAYSTEEIAEKLQLTVTEVMEAEQDALRLLGSR